MAETEEVVRGARFVIYAVKDSADAQSHLAQFMDRRMQDPDRRKLAAQILDVAEHGPPRNRERSNDLGDGLFELKAGPFRAPFFFDGKEGDLGRIVVTHAFRKSGRRTPPRELKKARRLREEVLQARGR